MHLFLRYVYLLNLAGILIIASFYGFIAPNSEHSSIPQVITTPWIGDPACDHFIVQVTCNYLLRLIFIINNDKNHFCFLKIKSGRARFIPKTNYNTFFSS
jgi:hypothetical protein